MTSFVWSKNAWYTLSYLCGDKLSMWLQNIRTTSNKLLCSFGVAANAKPRIYVLFDHIWIYCMAINMNVPRSSPMVGKKKSLYNYEVWKTNALLSLFQISRWWESQTFLRPKLVLYPNLKKFKSRSLDSYRYPHGVLWWPTRWTHSRNMLCWHSSPCKMLFYRLKVVPTATFVVVVEHTMAKLYIEFHSHLHGIISTWNLAPMSEENECRHTLQARANFFVIFVLNFKAIRFASFAVVGKNINANPRKKR